MRMQYLEEVFKALAEALPQSLHCSKQDLEASLRPVLSQVFEHLNLVTSEELDLQAKHLALARQELERLKGRLADLEQQFAKGSEE